MARPKSTAAMAGAADGGSPARGRAWTLRRWLPLLVILAVMAFAFAQGWHRLISLSTLIAERESLRAAVAANLPLVAAAYVAAYVAAVALSIPGAVFLTVAGGFLFGWPLGAALTAVAATVGATALFLAARSSLGKALAERAGPQLERLAAGFRADAFNYLLFLRLVPVFPFWLVNLAPALLNMRLLPYVVATFFGILPGTVAYSVVGAGLDSVVAAQEAANPGCAAAGTCAIELSALVTPQLVAAFAALGLLALVPVAARKWRRRRD